jgi:uncharacterized protein YdeI (YjbR/CyaY-like superfamily)
MAVRKRSAATSRGSRNSVQPANRAEWRRWLSLNYAKATEVIVVYARKDSGEPSITYAESVEEALCFGWIDGVRGKLDTRRFTVRFTPRRPGSLWSKLNLERVAHLRDAGRMHAAGLAAFDHGSRSGRHATAYATRDEVRAPVELTNELERNPRGRIAFEALSPGQRKHWTRWVASGAREPTREARARDALRLILAGRKAGETDAQAARRGVASKASILKR